MISIVVPTLHEETTLGRTLRALRVLDSTDYEIIVSDGDSRDRTLEIAHQYADRVVQHTATTRQNIAQGRNAGAAVAHGSFLVFLDADTWIDNPRIFFTETLRYFSHDPELLGITVNLKVFPDQATWTDKTVFNLVNFVLRVKNNLLHIGEATGEFMMIRKTAFNAISGFREDLVASEDADLFWRLSRVGRTRFCSSLTILHSGRRAHRVGWPLLLCSWTINKLWVTLFDRAFSKEWPVVR